MLQVDGLDVYYGDVQVLKGVTLDVKEKELVAVIGANGAGKTTLLKTISSLLKPRKGSITFEGKRISEMEAHQVVKDGHYPYPRRPPALPGDDSAGKPGDGRFSGQKCLDTRSAIGSSL